MNEILKLKEFVDGMRYDKALGIIANHRKEIYIDNQARLKNLQNMFNLNEEDPAFRDFNKSIFNQSVGRLDSLDRMENMITNMEKLTAKYDIILIKTLLDLGINYNNN